MSRVETAEIAIWATEKAPAGTGTQSHPILDGIRTLLVLEQRKITILGAEKKPLRERGHSRTLFFMENKVSYFETTKSHYFGCVNTLRERGHSRTLLLMEVAHFLC